MCYNVSDMALMQFLDKPIEDYLSALSPDRNAILAEMEKIAEKEDFPIVGPLIGQFLKQMATVLQAKRIFEMGSGFGYSAMWFLDGMPSNGEIYLTEDSIANIKRAEKFFKKADKSDQVHIVKGNALEVIDQVPGEFDIIFIDIKKSDYPKSYQKSIQRLRKGGLLIADNVLWSGTVVSPGNDQDELGIKVFNRLTHTSPQLTPTIVPIRDGLSISVKK